MQVCLSMYNLWGNSKSQKDKKEECDLNWDMRTHGLLSVVV